MIFHSYVSLPRGYYLRHHHTVSSVLLDEKNVHVWKQPARFMAYMPMIHHSPLYDQDDPLFVFFCGLNAHLNHIFTIPNSNFAQEKLSPSTLTLTNSVWASAPGVGYCKIYQNFAVGHRNIEWNRYCGFVWKRLKMGGYPKWRSSWWSPWDKARYT